MHKDRHEQSEKIRKLVEDLDKSVPQEGAHVRFRLDGDTPKMSKMEATKRGYLRLGLELMKAALEPRDGAQEKDVDVNIDYLDHNGSDIEFQSFKMLSKTQFDNAAHEPEETSYKSAMLYVGTFFIVLFLLALLLFTNVFSSIAAFFLALFSKLSI